jgi:hypothetical protein
VGCCCNSGLWAGVGLSPVNADSHRVATVDLPFQKRHVRDFGALVGLWIIGSGEMPYLVRSNVPCSGTINKYFVYDENEIDQVRNSQVEYVGNLAEAEEMAERLNAEMQRDFSNTNVSLG